MRIQAINSFNFNKPVINQPQVARYNQQSGDIVSFSAKKKHPPKIQSNPNVDFGVSVGDEVLSALNQNKSKEEVLSILGKRMPTVTIASIDELAGKTALENSFVAYFESRLNDDFEQVNRKMYLDLMPFKVADDKQKLVYAMDIAHESTHAKQVDSGKDANFYKKLSNGDANYAGTVIGIGKYISEVIDNALQGKLLASCFMSLEDQMNMYKYDREIPRIADVSRQSIIKNSGLKNYEQFEQKDVTVAGRIIAKRIMGKASFCTILDSDEKIQSYVSINDLGEESYKAFKTFDIGDIIGITGFVFKTKTEEIF